MASYEHLKILNQGVDIWNRWRKDKPDVVPDLRSSDLSHVEFDNINLSHSLLNKAVLNGAQLDDSDISYADLSEADLTGSHLTGACLTGSNCSRADFTSACLINAKANDAIFQEACFLGSYLIGADFSDSDLARANLDCVQAIDTLFCRAVFTGACISAWNPYNADLEGVECDYIFTHSEKPDGFEYFTDRLPHDPHSSFSLGEFAARFTVYQETVDIFFSEAINWPAFYQSFLDLKNEFPDDLIRVQGIRNLGSSYVISFEVSEDSNKAAIETQTKQIYESRLRMLKSQYERQLSGKEKEICDHKQTQTSLLQILQTMAEKHSSVQNFHGPVGNVAGSNEGCQKAELQNPPNHEMA